MSLGIKSKINDLEDLGDCLAVMEGIVENLKKPKLPQSQIEVLLNQYILLEDSILAGIETLSNTVASINDKNSLDLKTEQFNKVGSDFQDTWEDNYWACYEMIREGFSHRKLRPNTSDKVAHLQELALALNKSTAEDDKKEESKALEEVDELSRKYKPTNNPEPVSHKCCNCFIS